MVQYLHFRILEFLLIILVLFVFIWECFTEGSDIGRMGLFEGRSTTRKKLRQCPNARWKLVTIFGVPKFYSKNLGGCIDVFGHKDDNWPKKIKVLSEQPSVENVVDTQPFPQTRRCRKGEAPSPQGMGSMFIPSVGFHNCLILFLRYI